MGKPPAALRAALVAGTLLVALFAMHGLTHHGEHSPTASAEHAAMSVSAPGTAAPTGPPADDSAVLALCLAMLLGTTLVWLWATGFRGGVRHLRRDATDDAATRPLRRAHAPPDRWVLSVCRC